MPNNEDRIKELDKIYICKQEFNPIKSFILKLKSRWVEEERERIVSILQEMEPYLIGKPSGICDLVYRTPAQVLRESADLLEKKEWAIKKFKELIATPNKDI